MAIASRALAFLAVLLLAALPPALAQSTQPEEFTVMRVDRSGDHLTVELRANIEARDVVVAMYSGDTIVALPQQEYPSWPQGERRAGTYELLKEVDSATLRLRWTYPSGWTVTRQVVIHVPDAPEETTPDVQEPRVIVTDALLAGTRLRLDLENVGQASTGLLLVSLEDQEGRKVASPYYRSFETLGRGASASATFEVAEDARDLVAHLEYRNASEKTRLAIRTANETEADTTPLNVTLRTDLPFREADLGRTVDFAITVKNEGRLALVRLDVDGLAPGYSARFFVGGSAVPSLYLDRNQSRQVTLSITVPNSEAEVDRTLDLATVASVDGAELARLPMGLAVRGVGQLTITADEALPTLPPGGQVRTTVTVRNTGTAPLFNVDLDSRRPYGWTIRYEPSRIDRLDPGQSMQVAVEIRVPDVIAPGQYGADVSARSEDVSSRWATLSLEVEEGEGGGGAWLWVLFLALIGGTLAFGAWRKWRG